MNPRQTYKSRTGLFYEVTSRPFWGPKMKAIEALKQCDKRNISEEEFIDYLKSQYPQYFQHIHWIRFHNYIDKSFPKHKFDKRMCLAIINTLPNINARNIFFDERVEITQHTGWYPLVMGKRIGFRNTQFKKLNKRDIKSIGQFQSFNTIANSNKDGVSFELIGTNGSYLLDFGFNGSAKVYNACFLTHSHSDHSKGFQNTIKYNKTTPIISSKTGLSFLSRSSKSSNFYQIGYRDSLKLDDGFTIDFIRTYHSQGSVGFRFQDTLGISFYYFGDICLKNGFSDFRNEIIDFIDKTKTERNVVLLDGAMIGRKLYIDEDDTPEKLLEEFANNSEKRNLVFFSNQPENSIYSFLKLFNYTQKYENLRSSKIFVSKSLFPILQLIIEPIILNYDDYKDPVYNTLFGKHKSNPIESQRLYPLSDEILNQVKKDEKVILFSGINDLNKSERLRSRFEKADIILAGTFALREDLPEVLVKSRPRSIIRVASEDWSFHSNEDDIAGLIERINDSSFKVFIFHNYFNRLIHFIRNNKFNNNRIRALGDRYSIINIK